MAYRLSIITINDKERAMRGARRVPEDSVTDRRRLVQPLGGIVLLLGVVALVALLFAGIGTVTGSGAGVVLPLSYPAGGWQSVCADANINGMSFNGNGPTLVGAPGTTTVSGPTNPMSVCVLNATGRQRALAYLGSAPSTLYKLAVFVLVAWLLLVARRKGPFAPRVHRMLVVLGWFVIAGSAVASFAHGVAGTYFLVSAVTVPVPVKADVISALYDAVLGSPVLLVGCALLTLARIMRAGALMRDDLEGTV
jgi:hypothetical protein